MRELICIVCPNGCTLRCVEEGGRLTVSGNRCKRGEAFALEEIENPMRTVTSTVRTAFPGMPVLPVRTSREIPKGRVFDVMAAVNGVCVSAPVRRGDVILENVLGLHADIVATADTPVNAPCK